MDTKTLAAIMYALSLTRGLLVEYQLSGTIDKDDLTRILSATTTGNIAKAIGVSEDKLNIDWDDYLSNEEKEKIQQF